jgi:hypothetical protein
LARTAIQRTRFGRKADETQNRSQRPLSDVQRTLPPARTQFAIRGRNQKFDMLFERLATSIGAVWRFL